MSVKKFNSIMIMVTKFEIIFFIVYRTCAKILEKKRWDNDDSRTHFESGVRLGLATFNIMVAMLPPKIITLLEFVGFTADKVSRKYN